MPRVSEAGEIVPPHVHLLHERGLSVDHPAIFEYSVDLMDTALRINEVFEYGLDDHAIEGFVLERYAVRVRDERCVWPERDIGRDELETRVRRQCVHPVPKNAAADDQHYRSGRNFQQRIAKSSVILPGPDRRGDVRQLRCRRQREQRRLCLEL